MTVSDMWTRTYELFTDGYITRHIYYWYGPDDEAEYLTIGPRKNLHPPWTYTPANVTDVSPTGYVLHTVTPDPPLGHGYRRLTTPPSIDTSIPDFPFWDFSPYAIEEVFLVTNALGYQGATVDESGIPIAWEFGGADFSTPFPSWVFQFEPTHFSLLEGIGGPVIRPLLSHAQDDLDADSLERQEFNHVYTITFGVGAFSPDVGIGQIAGNGGSVSARHTPITTHNRFDQVPVFARDTSTGDLVGTMPRAFREKIVADVHDADPAAYVPPFIINWHHADRPTLRIRGWSVDLGLGGEGVWSIRHYGLYGTEDEDIPFTYTVAASGAMQSLLEWDHSLDLNTITPPAGTVFSEIGAAIYGEDAVSVIEGPETVCFADGGTRSGIGGSTYIPGRVMKLSNLADDGTIT